MADPQKHEYTPEELRDNMSNFDPKAAGDAAKPASYPGEDKGKSGPPPENSAEQARRDEKQSAFNNNPERDRDDHLTRIGRGHHTHG